MPRRLGDAVVGAQGLQKEAPDALLQHDVDGMAVALRRREEPALGRGAQIAEGAGVKGRGGLQRQPAARAEEGLPLLHAPGGEVLAGAVGVGLEGLGAGLQIAPVDAQDLFGVRHVGGIASDLLPSGETIIISSHGAVEDQPAAAI